MNKTKFRCWDRKNKLMLYQETDNWTTFGVAIGIKKLSVFWMQSSGVKDLRDKDIYDSDILRTKKDKDIGLVVFKDGSFVIEFTSPKILPDLKSDRPGFGLYVCDHNIKLMGLKIIGNIYQSPRLLMR